MARGLADMEAAQLYPKALPWRTNLLDITDLYPLDEDFDPDEDFGLGLLPNQDADGTVHDRRQTGDEPPDFR